MPPLEIELAKRFKSEARSLTGEELDQIDEALGLLSGAFKNPHLHHGLGIRRLTKNYF